MLPKRYCSIIIAINSLLDDGRTENIETIIQYIDECKIVDYLKSIFNDENYMDNIALDSINKYSSQINSEIWSAFYNCKINNEMKDYGIKNNGLCLLNLILTCILAE